MGLDKQLLGLLFGVAVVLFLWMKLRNPFKGKNDRRTEQRRSGPKERRVIKGRRKANQLQHESQLNDRRQQHDERRTGERTRRHKKRRKADNVH